MVSGLCHVSLCCWVGRDPGTLPGVGGSPLGKPMRKCSCAVPCGSAEVAERQGEGRAAGWILPSLTLEQVLPVAICGRCCL